MYEVWECAGCTARFTQDAPSQEAIGRYYKSDNYISHTNTSQGLINRLYHQVRNITLRQKRKLVQKVSGMQVGELLDVGAGTGFFADTMRSAGWKVTGLEPDDTARKRAAEVKIVLNDIADLWRLPASAYDVITMWHVLEHVHNLHGYLQQLHKLLKPSGKLIIAVPNYTSGDANAYQNHWAAYDVPRHLYHFSPQSIKSLLKNHGFTIQSVHPQWFDSFYVSMLSEKGRAGKLNIVRAAWNGLSSNLRAVSQPESCSSLIYVFSKQ